MPARPTSKSWGMASITVEYTLLAGVNDPEDAEALIACLARLRGGSAEPHPLQSFPGSGYARLTLVRCGVSGG